MITSKPNPLKLANIICVISFLVHLLLIMLYISNGMSHVVLLHTKSTNLIGLGLCLSFLISYSKRSILAWWIALIYFPIIFTTIAIKREKIIELSDIAVIAFMIYLAFSYLFSKYKEYNKYVKENKEFPGFPMVQNIELAENHNNPSFAWENPMKWALISTVVFAIFEISYLCPIVVVQPINYSRIFLYFFHHSFLFFLMFALLFFYRRNNILAWWISLIHIPLIWVLYNLFNSFDGMRAFIALCAFLSISIYLSFIYKPYKNHIAKN